MVDLLGSTVVVGVVSVVSYCMLFLWSPQVVTFSLRVGFVSYAIMDFQARVHFGSNEFLRSRGKLPGRKLGTTDRLRPMDRVTETDNY